MIFFIFFQLFFKWNFYCSVVVDSGVVVVVFLVVVLPGDVDDFVVDVVSETNWAADALDWILFAGVDSVGVVAVFLVVVIVEVAGILDVGVVGLVLEVGVIVFVVGLMNVSK